MKVSDEHLPSIVERMRRYGLEDRLTFSYGHCVHEGEQRPVLLCWLDGVPLLQALLPADEVDDDTLARAHRKCINSAARKVAADAWTEMLNAVIAEGFSECGAPHMIGVNERGVMDGLAEYLRAGVRDLAAPLLLESGGWNYHELVQRFGRVTA